MAIIQVSFFLLYIRKLYTVYEKLPEILFAEAIDDWRTHKKIFNKIFGTEVLFLGRRSGDFQEQIRLVDGQILSQEKVDWPRIRIGYHAIVFVSKCLHLLLIVGFDISCETGNFRHYFQNFMYLHTSYFLFMKRFWLVYFGQFLLIFFILIWNVK